MGRRSKSALHTQRRMGPTDEVHTTIVAAISGGATIPEAARQAGVSHGSVYRWIALAEAGRGLPHEIAFARAVRAAEQERGVAPAGRSIGRPGSGRILELERRVAALEERLSAT